MNDDNKDDPFNKYGYGVMAYFKLLRSLMATFLIISLLIAPVMWLYSMGNTLEYLRNGTVNQFTLGNVGFVESKCYN